jgi:hypothetical protein
VDTLWGFAGQNTHHDSKIGGRDSAYSGHRRWSTCPDRRGSGRADARGTAPDV